MTIKNYPNYKRQARYRSRIGVILFCPAIQVYLILKNKEKRSFRWYQVDKKTYIMFVKIE